MVARARARSATHDAARFARRTAWRALVLADAVAPAFRAPAIHLWLGHGSHLVHYPVKAGAMINIVAIAADAQPSHGWSTAAAPDEVLARFSRRGLGAGRRATCWRCRSAGSNGRSTTGRRARIAAAAP